MTMRPQNHPGTASSLEFPNDTELLCCEQRPAFTGKILRLDCRDRMARQKECRHHGNLILGNTALQSSAYPHRWWNARSKRRLPVSLIGIVLRWGYFECAPGGFWGRARRMAGSRGRLMGRRFASARPAACTRHMTLQTRRTWKHFALECPRGIAVYP